MDDMFLLNLVINYLLLVATAKLCALPLKRGRFALAAALGAAYSVALLLPSMGFLSSPVIKLSLGAVMILISFGSNKSLLKPYLAFLCVSAACAGAVIAVSLLTGTPAENGYYIGASMKTLILTFAAAYFVLTLVFSRITKRRSREVLTASIVLCSKTHNFTALRDTGNELFDPISRLPVMVMGLDAATALLPSDCLAALYLGASDFIQSLSTYPELKSRFRLVPYSAIGTKSGLLPVFRPDSLTINDKETKNLLVGLSPINLSPDNEFSAII